MKLEANGRFYMIKAWPFWFVFDGYARYSFKIGKPTELFSGKPAGWWIHWWKFELYYWFRTEPE